MDPLSSSPTSPRSRSEHEPSESSSANWTYASPDLNVLLCGHIIDRHAAPHTSTATFRLDNGRESIHIQHPSLVTVHSTSTEQFLVSLNTGKPLLSIPIPISSSSSSSSSEQEPLSIVTVHFPLVTREQYADLVASSLYSTVFRVLLDGPEFVPPHFDPHATAPSSSPQLTPPTTRDVAHSPTLQRALWSPLLSPQRRAHSQGSDTSVPPLSLGRLASARTPSLDPNSTTPTTASNPTPLIGSSPFFITPKAHLPLSTIFQNHLTDQIKRTTERILRLKNEQEAYTKRASLEFDLLTTRIERASHHTAPIHSNSPNKQVEPTTTTTGTSPTTAVQRGFPETYAIERALKGGTRSDSVERERSKDRLANEIAEERERSIRGPEAAKRDESISSRIRAEDEKEQEERGRSGSRVKKGSKDEAAKGRETSQTRRSESRSGKAVAEVVAAVKGTLTVNLVAPTNEDVGSASRSRSPYKVGQVISATLDDEDHPAGDDTPDTITLPTSVTTTSNQPQPQPSTRKKNLEDGTAIDHFVPSVNSLVAIPETEELALEEEENGRRGRDARTRELPKTTATTTTTTREETSSVGDEEDEEEHDAPFEMDEDIDVEDLELGSPPTSTAPVPVSTGDVELAAATTAPTSPQVTASTSYRPSSFRPSTLSSSYAALLQTSMARQQQQQHNYQQHTSFKSPSTTTTSLSSPPNASSSSFRIPPLDLSATISESPPDASPATSTTAREDAQIALLESSHDRVDPEAMKQGEQKLREVLAIDAPSHRSPLPRKGQRFVINSGKTLTSKGGEEEISEDDREIESDQERLPNRFAVGSLPISIGMGQPRRGGHGGLFNGEIGAGGTRDREGERELQRKTSVPVREGMFVPPLLRKKNETITTTSAAVPFDLTPSRPSAASTSNKAIGAMTIRNGGLLATSLARSSRNYFPVVQDKDRNEQGQSADAPTLSGGMDLGRRGSIHRAGTGTTKDARFAEDENEEEEDEESFVPPHEMVKVGRSDEELLSRSVDDY